jgi:DNA-directed RNA polymerase subunit RPC12/RpoP
MDNQTKVPTPPKEEITLRCNRCGRPITAAEAIQTPTGYRCPECVRQQQKVFDTTKPLDVLWGFLIALGLSFIGSIFISRLGFFIFLIAPAVGVVVAEAVRWVVKKRRSKRLFRAVSAGMILGAIPQVLMSAITFFVALMPGSFNIWNLLPLVYHLIYLFMAVPSAYYRLSGLRR